MTAIRLALFPRHASLLADARVKPSVLVSYAYCPTMQAAKVFSDSQHLREWVLDSGAFTVANSGRTLANGDYIKAVHEFMSLPRPPSEVFALDVIGDGRRSLDNAYEMRRSGINCIPTFHIGGNYELLREACAEFEKVAIGGMVKKIKADVDIRSCLDEVFRREWPKKFHAFGVAKKTVLLRYPFHSSDASSWQIGPLRYRRFKSMPGIAVRQLHHTKLSLRGEVDDLMKLESEIAAKWKKELSRWETGKR